MHSASYAYHRTPGSDHISFADLDVQVVDWVEHLGQLRATLADQGPLGVFSHLPSGHNLT